MSTASVGVENLIAFDDTAIDAGSTSIDFVSENIRNAQEIIHPTGIRGTRSRNKERARKGLERVGGTITTEPSPTELDFILPKILGATEVADVFALAETISEFVIGVQRTVKEFTYSGCKIVRASFSGAEGTPLRLAMDIVGKTSADNPKGTATYPTPDLDTMYVFTDGILTLLSAAREMSDVEVIIENVHEDDRFTNSTTRTDVPIIDRNVLINCTVPYDSTNEDLHDQPLAGGAGTLVFTNGGQSLTFTFANIKFASEDPVQNDRGEIVLPLRGVALKSASTLELVVTHDSVV